MIVAQSLDFVKGRDSKEDLGSGQSARFFTRVAFTVLFIIKSLIYI